MTATTPLPTYLAIASLRAIREYAAEPIPDDALRRMLQAGRATGSASNRQPWRFYVIRDRATLGKLSELVYEPENIADCQVAIAIVMTRSRNFDAGRVAQNIALAAWADGIGTCPNGIRDLDGVRALLNLEADWEVPTILSAGYPARPRRVHGRDPEAILERIDRKPLEELTHWID